MQLGEHMRELWGHKVGLALALALAVLAATSTLYGISLFPPSLERHSLQVGSASTHVLVDTPQSSAIDLRQDTYSFTELSNRALLLGNLMTSLSVRKFIGLRAGIPPQEIRVSAPLTPEQPRAIADAAHQPKSSDILKSPEEYRLSIQSNPTVPIIDVYSEAPSSKSAVTLANAAVDGLRDYLDALARKRLTPMRDQVDLVQLGKASGGVVDRGAGAQLAIIVFLLVFAVSCAIVLFVARVRRGWAEAKEFEQRSLSTIQPE